jgi:hypothetical protein
MKQEKIKHTFHPPSAFPNPDQTSAAFPVAQFNQLLFFVSSEEPTPIFLSLAVDCGFCLADI